MLIIKMPKDFIISCMQVDKVLQGDMKSSNKEEEFGKFRIL